MLNGSDTATNNSTEHLLRGIEPYLIWTYNTTLSIETFQPCYLLCLAIKDKPSVILDLILPREIKGRAWEICTTHEILPKHPFRKTQEASSNHLDCRILQS